MALNNQLEGYSHPMYSELHEHRICRIAGPVSLTDFAHFRTRNTVIVRAVHLYCRSAPSSASAATTPITSGSLFITRAGTTIRTTVTLAGVVATYSLCVTLVSSNTLTSMGDYAAVRIKGMDGGEWDVLWEYDVIYPATKIGS